jgi:hypothetical protein
MAAAPETAWIDTVGMGLEIRDHFSLNSALRFLHTARTRPQGLTCRLFTGFARFWIYTTCTLL